MLKNWTGHQYANFVEREWELVGGITLPWPTQKQFGAFCI